MKKVLLFSLVLGTLFALGMNSTVGQADTLPGTMGILFERTTSCNDRYVVVNQLDTNIYEAHGYEYGCGNTGYMCTGTVLLAGGYAYFGLTENNNYMDYGQIASITAPILLSSRMGTGTYMYIYTMSGTFQAHGTASAGFAVSIGTPPSAGIDKGPNDSIR